MFDKPQSSQVIGLEIDGFIFRGIALNLVRGKLQFKTSFEYPIESVQSETDDVKPLYTDEQKEQLEALFDQYLSVSSMEMANTLVRPLELKLKKDKDIDAVLSFQAEPLLPYPVEDAVLDRILISRDKEGSRLSILAVRKDHLTQHLKRLHDLEIEPEIISADPQALAIFSQTFITSEEPYITLHLGISSALCVLIDNGKLIAAQNIPNGIELLLNSYSNAKKIDLNTTYKQLDAINLDENTPEFQQALETLRLPITRTIYALTKQLKNKKVDTLLITGPGATIPRLAESICQQLNKTLLTPANDVLPGMTPNELLTFALPIGAALTALPLNHNQINFRQNEFAYPAPWKRLKKPLTLYFTLCVALAIALTLFGKAYLSYQQADIKIQYLDLLDVMNKPYNDFEKEMINKHLSTRDLPPDEIVKIEALTNDEIRTRLQYLEKDIQSTPQIFPLQPNVPLVSDVLAWIGTHPSFVGKPDLTKKENETPSLTIENFTYTMIKRPEPTKKQEKYQVKVELEFASPSPKMAREFHDALIAPNDIVDGKAEVKWSSNRDKYRTSFYLKDRTLYPSF